MRVRTLVLVLVALGLLAACGVRPRTQVEPVATTQRNQPAAAARRPAPARGTYQVVRGDTLYGIAFRHGLDYRDLARWNQINSPYTIYPGQRLRLNGSAAPVRTGTVATAPGTPTSGPTTAPAAKPAAPTPQVVPAVKPVAAPAHGAGNSAARSGANAPGQPAASPAPARADTPPPATTPVVAGAPSRSVQGIHWRWPASGQLVGRFAAGDQTRQGIGIAGKAGDPVLAAADGEVVYSGSGLLGYGELVIIKHSSDFLSAYGHNRKRLVNEGQRVRAGQQIAEMGRTGASRDMLHFEIRKTGKPVDPLGFLPAR